MIRVLAAGAVVGTLALITACAPLPAQLADADDTHAAFTELVDATRALSPDGVMIATPPVAAACDLPNGVSGVKWMTRWTNGAYTGSAAEIAAAVEAVWDEHGLNAKTTVPGGDEVVRGKSDLISSAVFLPANGSARFTTVCADGDPAELGAVPAEKYRDDLVAAVTAAATAAGWVEGLPEPEARRCRLPDERRGVKWHMYGTGPMVPTDVVPGIRTALDAHGATQVYSKTEERGAYRMSPDGLNIAVTVTARGLDVAAVSGCVPRPDPGR